VTFQVLRRQVLKLLSTGMSCTVDCQQYVDVSEVFTASIIRAMSRVLIVLMITMTQHPR
jgi:energy-converting hydrogenase Eha subunit C